MPHDHPHHHHHHGHGHHHDHPHGGRGHNHSPDGPPDHLHSHAPEAEASEALHALTAQFIDGFRTASDKAAYLRIAGVPLEIESETGGPMLKLVDVSVTSAWAVGAAAPAFGSADLSYLPYPGDLIRERTNCSLVYVSLRERRDMDLREFLKPRTTE